MQRQMPATVPPAMRCFSTSHVKSTTQIGAVVAKKVALAIVVARIERCQSSKSPAKSSPEITAGHVKVGLAPLPAWRSSNLAHAQSMGRASDTRQNADANGPTPSMFDSRTKSGDTPIANAPIRSARTAKLRARCCALAAASSEFKGSRPGASGRNGCTSPNLPIRQHLPANSPDDYADRGVS